MGGMEDEWATPRECCNLRREGGRGGREGGRDGRNGR